MATTVATAIAKYGASTKAKLASIAVEGAPEDPLRGLLEILVHDRAELAGLPAGAVHLAGETALAALKTRPDFAVAVGPRLWSVSSKQKPIPIMSEHSRHDERSFCILAR